MRYIYIYICKNIVVFLNSDSHLPKILLFYLRQWWKMLLISSQKLFLFSRYLRLFYNCFTFWDIGQYVYYNCLFPRLFPSFELDFIFLIMPFFCKTKRLRQNINILRMKKAFKVKDNTFTIIFKRLSF